MKTEQYLREHNNSGLKIGDKVKVIMKCPSYARGWDRNWCSSMDKTIGLTGVIKEDYGTAGFSVEIEYNCWEYPYSVLEKVESEPQKKSRPFNNVFEFIPYSDKKIKRKNTENHYTLLTFGGDGVKICTTCVTHISFYELYNDYTFSDGSVCGVTEN